MSTPRAFPQTKSGRKSCRFFLHRETLIRREFLNPCRLRHTSPILSSLWPAATTGLRRMPAGGISASLKCGRNLRFPHKRPLPGTCSLFSFHFARQGHINQGIPDQFSWVAREPPAAGARLSLDAVCAHSRVRKPGRGTKAKASPLNFRGSPENCPPQGPG